MGPAAAQVGFDHRYLLAYLDGELVGGAQVLERSLPALGRVGYLPYGPILTDGCADQAAVRTALCDELERLARTRLRALFVQPPGGTGGTGGTGGAALAGAAVSAELMGRGFRVSDSGVAPAATLRVDLNLDLATLRAGLSKRLRTWTNRWEARGVTVRRGTEADLTLLAELVADSGRHRGFAAVSADYLRALQRELGDDAVLFVGELAGRPAAVALYTRCAGTLTLRFAGMDRSEETSKNSVSAAVQWSAIRWAKREGLDWFDLGGISAESAELLVAGGPREELRGVDRFKASLGGRVYRYPPAVELISGPLTRAGYDLARRWAPGRRAIEQTKRLLRTGRLSNPTRSGVKRRTG